MSAYKCDSNRNLNTKMRQLKPADLKEKEVFMCNQSELSKKPNEPLCIGKSKNILTTVEQTAN